MTGSRATAARPLVALATSPQFPDLLEEGPLLRGALARVGVDAQTTVWSDPAKRTSTDPE